MLLLTIGCRPRGSEAPSADEPTPAAPMQHADTPEPDEDHEGPEHPPDQLARRFVDALATGEIDQAHTQLSKGAAKAWSTKDLQAVWNGMEDRFGSFRRVLQVDTTKAGAAVTIRMRLSFAHANGSLSLAYDRNREIVNLLMDTWDPPAYATATKIREQDLVIGQDPWKLPATLTSPEGKGPFPAVVLVHGSGPHDRDETIGPNKPFRDLAWGLASRGIAVLRYVKRTKVHSVGAPEIMATFTVNEFVQDALAAAEALRKRQEIDRDGIFVLGHSQGGTLIPRIGDRDPKLAGLIMMAASTRPMDEVLVEQAHYLAEVDGEVTDEERARIEQMEQTAARIADPDLKPPDPDGDPPPELIFGASAAFWLDLRDDDPAKAAKRLQQPLLVLQGGRDYQVTPEGDYKRLQQHLSGQPNVELQLYPELNHLFMPGEGPSKPEEYMEPGHVDEAVIEDIARFIEQTPDNL